MRQLSQIDPLPEGAKILHLGPPKTGTTVVQSALHNSRESLARHGVSYPAPTRHPRPAFAAVSYDFIPDAYHASDIKGWYRLSKAFRESDAAHTILSSETLSNASDEQAQRIVEDLGGDLYIVLTVRPLASVLSSRWQQYVQDFMVTSYEHWLEKIFDETTHRDGVERFWQRYRLDEHVRRWGSIVGEDHLVFLVLDPSDRDLLLHSFDRMLGMPEGTLVPDPRDLNTSLPYPEIEMVRAFNRRFAEQGLSRKYYIHSVRMHSRPLFKIDPAMNAHKVPIPTPAWAMERSNALQVRMNEALRASNATVVGDLSVLVQEPAASVDTTPPKTVTIESAAAFAWTTFVGAQNYEPHPEHGPADGPLEGPRRIIAEAAAPGRRSVDDVSSAELLRVIGSRLTRRLRRR